MRPSRLRRLTGCTLVFFGTFVVSAIVLAVWRSGIRMEVLSPTTAIAAVLALTVGSGLMVYGSRMVIVLVAVVLLGTAPYVATEEGGGGARDQVTTV